MDFFENLKEWFVASQLPEQIKDVDIEGLFSNPWFMVPFVVMICYMLFKQKWKDLIIVALFVGVWWVSGTNYMDTLLVNGEMQIDKVLPVVFGGAAVLGFVIYLFLGRSD